MIEPFSQQIKKENLGALEIELTAEDLREIREAMAKITVVGHRY